MSQNHIDAHIDLITQHEQEFLARRTKSERWGDQLAIFVGSFRFVGFQLLLFGIWIAWNVFPNKRQFDPVPFFGYLELFSPWRPSCWPALS